MNGIDYSSSGYAMRLIKGFISSAIIKFASFKLKVDERNSATVEDYVELAFSWHFLKELTIRPSQIKAEIIRLLALVAELNPKVVLEIGTAEGGTLYLFSKVATSDATIISVDLPGGKFGGGYPEWKMSLYRAFARDYQKIHLIRGNSHDPLTLSKVKKIIDGHMVDFLFIDGDHSYEGVEKDFEMYSPLVRKGAIIAFHDIAPGSEQRVGGVPMLWSRIKTQYEYQEIVNDWKQKGYGIGVIFV